MKKYIAIAAAVLMQVCLGGIYAWSAFVPALRSDFGYTSAQTQLVFGLTIAVLCLATLWTGRLQDRYGPRQLSVLSGLLLALGYSTAGLYGQRFPMLLAGISVVNGLAIGCGYVCAIATGVKWFPKHKGAIAGLAVAGYGGGAILLAAIAQTLLSRGWPVLSIFRFVGAAYGPVVVLAGLLMFLPPHSQGRAPATLSGRVLLRDRRFHALALGIFCGTFPGLTVIGNLKPLGMAMGTSSAVATAAISALAAGNVSGRIAWGALQDRFGARFTTLLSLSLITLSLLVLPVAGRSAAGFLMASVFLGFCYGGSLAIYAAQAAHEYGSHVVGSVYAWVLLSHGLAAIVAPPLGGFLFDRTGSFVWPVMLAAGVALAGTLSWARLAAATR